MFSIARTCSSILKEVVSLAANFREAICCLNLFLAASSLAPELEACSTAFLPLSNVVVVVADFLVVVGIITLGLSVAVGDLGEATLSESSEVFDTPFFCFLDGEVISSSS